LLVIQEGLRFHKPNCRSDAATAIPFVDHAIDVPKHRNIIARRMALIAGTKLGPYEIQSPLGAGGMGEVYRAMDTRLDRTVAIKILPTHLFLMPAWRGCWEYFW
jgi:serine/threonine protein kinase